MSENPGHTTSVWMADVEVPVKTPLREDTRADVCIVGAGIAGLSVAYELSKLGKLVVVLDAGTIGGGETGRTTAHLSCALDDRYMEIERLHGERGAQIAAESHSMAIDRIGEIVQEEQIDCEFTRLSGYLFVPPGDDPSILDDELAASHRAGLLGVEKLERAPLRSFDTGPCLRFPDQGQFHPLRYIVGLVHAIERAGGRIYTHTHVEQVEGGYETKVTTSDHYTVTAAAVVVATNTPVQNMVAIHTKQAPYRTYAIALRIPAGTVEPGLYWDTPDPYHYVRLDGDEILIVGGEDHKTGQASDTDLRFVRLESWARERFPQATEVLYRWSGQVMEPVDAMAFIGQNPGDKASVYIATGDSGHGMTHGVIAGMLLKDLILERQNSWSTLYDPARITIGAAGEFAKENLNVAGRYAELLTGGEISSDAELQAGEGAILRKGLRKLAVYRDADGVVHEMSALCPHLDCVVHWNPTEKSWDCPCHGSRFECTGEVISGPAISNLSRV